MTKRIAFVSAGVITNIAVFGSDFVPSLGQVDVTNIPAGIGWAVVNGVPVAPAPPAPAPQTVVARSAIYERMSAAEIHAWRRAVVRAEATNTPAAADRNACYAWHRFNALPDDAVDLTKSEVTGLKAIWMALGMSAARADVILAPVVP